ncbi:hypothetical protein NQ314_009720 [Rhamnusium bicolor]|uniref:Uncharacterized protein n=1 Tax=Rhamnusium bicolor TaxID=1586634 RepID=A0AAV8XWR0_9CUCU|nr:hypothetical protein NQ314_009720 [Rhamnusium bicolor]
MESKSTANDQGNAIKRDLISLFRTTGLISLDADQVLKKLADETSVNANDAQNVLVSYLKEQRHPILSTRRNKKRTKSSVEAGKSISAQYDESSFDNDINENLTQDDDNDLIDILQNNEEEVNYIEANRNELRVGMFLLVKVPGGKRKKCIYRYVAMVQTVGEYHDIEVLGLKSCEDSRKIFKVVEDDKFSVDMEDIIAIPDPLEDGVGENEVQCNFSQPVDVKRTFDNFSYILN